MERSWCAKGSQEAWTERGVVVRAPMHANHQAAGWDKRLTHAEPTLAALTPPRGRGQRPITDAATLVEAMDIVLTDQRVAGVLSVAWEKPGARHTQDVGWGRGSASRPQRVIQKPRSHITRIARQEDNSADLRQRFGWKACVTNAGQTRRSWQEAVWGSRHAYRVDRVFNRLKRRVPIAPLIVWSGH